MLHPPGVVCASGGTLSITPRTQSVVWDAPLPITCLLLFSPSNPAHHLDFSAPAPPSLSDVLVLTFCTGVVLLGAGSRGQSGPKGATEAWGLAEFPAKQRGTSRGDASCPGPPGGTGQAHLIWFGCKLLVGPRSCPCSWPCTVNLTSPHPFSI